MASRGQSRELVSCLARCLVLICILLEFFMVKLLLKVPVSDDVAGAMAKLVAERIEYVRILKEADASGDEEALSGFPDSFVDDVRALDMHNLGVQLVPVDGKRVVLVLF